MKDAIKGWNTELNLEFLKKKTKKKHYAKFFQSLCL